ncbi:MAG: glycosyltransferase family 2 protein [Planctomycetota bacterium]
MTASATHPAAERTGSATTPPAVSILIVSYKSCDLVLEALRGLFRHTRRDDFEILLTDCSRDGTERAVAEAFPDVRVIPATGNLGFAGGNNFLARHARGRLLLLLNPDVIVADDAIGELVACAEARPDAGAWGGVTVLPDGRTDPSCRQSLPTLGRLAMGAVGFAARAAGGLADDETEAREVEALSGAFMLVDRAVWERLGGFDLSFFMYAEELDLCYRIARSGRPVVMTPKARITHLVGSGSALSPQRQTAIHRAKMHFLRKHRGVLFAAIGGAALWLAAFNRWAGGSVMTFVRKSSRFRDLRDGYGPVVFQPFAWWGGYGGTADAS